MIRRVGGEALNHRYLLSWERRDQDRPGIADSKQNHLRRMATQDAHLDEVPVP